MYYCILHVLLHLAYIVAFCRIDPTVRRVRRASQRSYLGDDIGSDKGMLPPLYTDIRIQVSYRPQASNSVQKMVKHYELGILDQRPNLSTYSVVLLGFPVRDYQIDHVKYHLHRAADQLGTAFPWLRGRVQRTFNHQDETPSSGTYYLDLHTKHDILKVQDINPDGRSYAKIVLNGAPMHMLPAQSLTDQRGFPEHIDPSKEHAPAFKIKANFVLGGLLLCFATNHNVSDMTGQAQLIRLFALAMRAIPFTPAQVEIGNIDRILAIPKLRSREARMEFPIFKREKRPRDSVQDLCSEVTSDAIWKTVRFPAESLSWLKVAANRAAEDAVEDPSVDVASGGWASTNDALSAFLWQRICKARMTSTGSHQETRMVRILDCRQRVNPPIPREYIGNFVFATVATSPVRCVQDSRQFATIAKDLRRVIHSVNDYTIRAFVSRIDEDSDKSAYDFDASLRGKCDLTISSWAEMGLNSIDFGFLGMPDFARRPLMAPSESCVYLVDKTKHGDIDAAMCLSKDDWVTLAKDDIWNKHAAIVD